MEVDRQLRFKSHMSMHVEFTLDNKDVMTHGCSSIAAPALADSRKKKTQPPFRFRQSCRKALWITLPSLRLRQCPPPLLPSLWLRQSGSGDSRFSPHHYCFDNAVARTPELLNRLSAIGSHSRTKIRPIKISSMTKMSKTDIPLIFNTTFTPSIYTTVCCTTAFQLMSTALFVKRCPFILSRA